MDLIFLSFVFVLSLFVGSFLGVVLERTYRGEQFVRGKSYCESCKHQLNTADLIPLFSFLFLKGKCRYCKKPIPYFLPLIEFITALSITTVIFFVNRELGAVSSIPFENFVGYFAAITLTVVLILIFLTDAKYMVIPDIYLLLFLFVYPIYFYAFKAVSILTNNIPIIKDDIFAAIVLALFFALLHYGSSKKAMGEGDIYLAAIIGLYLGTELSMVMWFIAFLTGAILGVILLLAHKKKMKSALPFGPFLIIGMIYALLFGVQTLNWYLSL
jgi:leader peptidase (prepilin peptidase)/N-methyltransferase